MKNILSLNGPWRLAGFEPGQANWSAPDALLPRGAQEIVGNVPGEVQVDLHRAGIIPDPYYGANAGDLGWIEEREWWYKRTFEVEEDFLQLRTFIEFDGLCSPATAYLNGREIGASTGVFTPCSFDVTEIIREGRNTVALKFRPSSETARERGWQRRFTGAGLWQEARLVSYDSIAITDVHVETEIIGNYANAWVTIELGNYTGDDQQVLASVVIAREEAREHIEVSDWVSPFGGVLEAVIRIEEPELWWPNGSGEQPLYTCMVGVQFEGEVQDVAERKFGIRGVAIVEQNEQGGDAFTFMVNGEEVFCKGGNWIPADCFVSSMTPDRYRDLVKMAKDANLNMLRVWEGGIYEAQEFYDACDEMGIMVWQDFMLGGSGAEIEDAVKRLRNHPSIVLWCRDGGSPDTADAIPNILRRFDHARSYKSYAPVSGSFWPAATAAEPNRWTRTIAEQRPPFDSRLVTQGPPTIESLREFIPEDAIFPPTGEVWALHASPDGEIGALVDLTRKMVGNFENAEQFAACAGILQGEFIRAEIEQYRRQKWITSGALLWTYNDCWPAVSGSIVDYYMRPKTAYYYAKRASAPVLVSFEQVDDLVRVHVTSDNRADDLDAILHVGVLSFESSGLETNEVSVRLAANTSRAVWESSPLPEILSDPTRQCIVAFLTVRGEMIAKSAYFAPTPGEMDFPAPKLLIQREQVAERIHRLTFAADAYARNVAISGLPASARPSDNWFDLLPGEQHTVVVDNIGVEEAKALTVYVWRK